MRGNRLAHKVLCGQAGNKVAGQAEEAAESGFAQKGAVQIDGMGVKAGEQARGAADSEHAVQFNPDAHRKCSNITSGRLGSATGSLDDALRGLAGTMVSPQIMCIRAKADIVEKPKPEPSH
jgi:hypothetical protein